MSFAIEPETFFVRGMLLVVVIRGCDYLLEKFEDFGLISVLFAVEPEALSRLAVVMRGWDLPLEKFEVFGFSGGI